jgi:hypothetical protein
MRTILLAMALSSVAAIATAQEADMAEMRQAHSMLQTNIERLLGKYDIDADVENLTLSQLAAIAGVAEQSGSMSEVDLRGQIEAITRRQ